MGKQNYRKTRSQKHIKQIKIYRIQLFFYLFWFQFMTGPQTFTVRGLGLLRTVTKPLRAFPASWSYTDSTLADRSGSWPHRGWSSRCSSGGIIQICAMSWGPSLFRYQGHIGTYLIMGGVDITGPSLYEIAAHGSTSKVPFCTMGSGTLAAMSVLESQ